MSRTILAVLILALLSSDTVGAQDTPITPVGWSWKTDRAATPARGGPDQISAAQFAFTHMAPGWHITMGPGGVLFPASDRAEGRFVLEGELIYFSDGRDGAEHGVIVGGSGLEGMHASWTAFVVNPEGKAAVMKHEHGATTMLLDWKTVAGANARDTTGFARNTVTVRAEPDSVRFMVNGARVGAWPRAAMNVDGSYGFRIGAGANLHITNLDLTRRLAPFPARR
jgi:hypothetical protein